jgi:hypothetical protein
MFVMQQQVFSSEGGLNFLPTAVSDQMLATIICASSLK